MMEIHLGLIIAIAALTLIPVFFIFVLWEIFRPHEGMTQKKLDELVEETMAKIEAAEDGEAVRLPKGVSPKDLKWKHPPH